MLGRGKDVKVFGVWRGACGREGASWGAASSEASRELASAALHCSGHTPTKWKTQVLSTRAGLCYFLESLSRWVRKMYCQEQF